MTGSAPCKACGLPTRSYTGYCRRRGEGHADCMRGHNSVRWHTGGMFGLCYVGTKCDLAEGGNHA